MFGFRGDSKLYSRKYFRTTSNRYVTVILDRPGDSRNPKISERQLDTDSPL